MKFLEEDGVKILRKNEELIAIRKELGSRLRKSLVRRKSIDPGDSNNTALVNGVKSKEVSLQFEGDDAGSGFRNSNAKLQEQSTDKKDILEDVNLINDIELKSFQKSRT